jgi:hypothetical protein
MLRRHDGLLIRAWPGRVRSGRYGIQGLVKGRALRGSAGRLEERLPSHLPQGGWGPVRVRDLRGSLDRLEGDPVRAFPAPTANTAALKSAKNDKI